MQNVDHIHILYSVYMQLSHIFILRFYIIYIYISITVVWQPSDLCCNTRASSFCSPENVGEQGIHLIIDD